jgi:hypothetical protein
MSRWQMGMIQSFRLSVASQTPSVPQWIRQGYSIIEQVRRGRAIANISLKFHGTALCYPSHPGPVWGLQKRPVNADLSSSPLLLRIMSRWNARDQP